MKRIALAAILLAAALVLAGNAIDSMRPLRQLPLWSGIQLASIGGVSLGLAMFRQLSLRSGSLLALVLAGILAWRFAYFPIMVFSGHVASIGEWLLLAFDLPVAIYPTFLLSIAGIHAAAAAAAGMLFWPPRPRIRLAVAAAFLVAASVSFNQLEDLTWFPDPVTRIPPSPWATTVKAVLEGLFHADPFASSAARVREHYTAYHASHAQIGCRDLAECPPGAP
ncbi:MAG: hypothetical protein JRH01_03045 [Deltaproteobacteria bacterium]|nr:hypothetical protein [Deltaproteobacteria bacterium]